MYSIVMLAAMSAAPETPDFCCLLKKNRQQDQGYGYQQQYCNPYYAQPNYGGGGKSFMGCNLFSCNKGQGGYGNGNGAGGFLGCGLFSKFCNKGGGYGHGNGGGGFLGCGLFSKFCGGRGQGQAGYGDDFYGPYGPAPEIVAPKSAEAEVVVLMPAAGKLIANGQATEGNGTTRSFQTPTLAVGQDFRYEMKVEIEEDGQTKTVTKQVMVRAGHRTTVDFTEKVNTNVTVTLPAKAKLLVDGTDTLMTGGTHTFTTPALAKGQPFSYKFRAEIEKDGKMEIVTQDVSFKAGEAVTVDFTKTATVAK